MLDTNILISGIFWKGDSDKIIELWVQDKIQTVVSIETLDELYRILSEFKIKLPKEVIDKHMNFVKENSMMVEPAERFSVVSDPSDNKFIECAVAGGACAIITYDKELLKLDGFRGIRIMKPEEYLSSLRK